ncbi:MAG: tRNA (5-methylaminomethyl-2-thiouridine)(34)-methyltransferase MnmD [Gammaproteobacteria bacterium]|nr:tRNA (5-methylaminomethyl-2-thiouridine)(34)-methyltransferase MnmD [Gammaproteobacteria bacterium]
MTSEPGLVVSADGSHTLRCPISGETYHNHNGAARESDWVFITTPDLRARLASSQVFKILEIGFGTGLNARLIGAVARKHTVELIYDSFEPHPISNALFLQLNHEQWAHDTAHKSAFSQLLRPSNQTEVRIKNTKYTLLQTAFTKNTHLINHYDHIVMDAFSPANAPSLWEEHTLQNLYNHLIFGGTLSTYCVAGEIRRRLSKVGFQVEKHPGPPGKREILLARKPSKT